MPLFTSAQQNSLTFGVNVTHFSDWSGKRFLNYFNPEVGYSKQLSDRYSISNVINIFYGENAPTVVKEGGVIYRLNFSNDVTLNYFFNNFSFSVGPSVRYRNERKILYFYPQPEPFEFVIDRNKSHFDIGGTVSTAYNLRINRKSLVSFKLAHRMYNKGANPVSFGISYGRSWN